MFRRDPHTRALEGLGAVLGADVRGLRGRSRAALGQGGVLAAARGEARFVVGLGGVPAESVFELASVSKPFTAALAQALVSAGALDWDRPLAALGGAWRGLPAGLTPRALATHTAGLPPHPARVALTTFTRFADPYGGMDPGAVLASARRWAPRAPARSARPRFLYSNLGVGLLALALAEVAGEDRSPAGYARALERHITGPLGVAVTASPPPTGAARPAGTLGGAAYTGFGPLLGAGGLYGAADALLTFGLAHLDGRAGTHWQTTLRPPGLPPHLAGVAPGWFADAGGTLRWHDGVARGTRTALGFDAASGAVVAVLARGGLPLLGRRDAVSALLLGLLGRDTAEGPPR